MALADQAMLDAFNKKQLEEHNKYRALHKDTEPLVLDAQLTKNAQAWSEGMLAKNKMEHD